MHRTIIALVLSLSFLQIGCGGDDAEINGKATVVTQDGDTFILDTGSDGGDAVSEGDEWDASCERVKGIPAMYLDHLSSADKGFTLIWLDGRLPRPGVLYNAQVTIDTFGYIGLCDVKHTKTGDDPYEFDISTEACKLGSERYSVRIESASFHVKTCPAAGDD